MNGNDSTVQGKTEHTDKSMQPKKHKKDKLKGQLERTMYGCEAAVPRRLWASASDNGRAALGSSSVVRLRTHSCCHHTPSVEQCFGSSPALNMQMYIMMMM